MTDCALLARGGGCAGIGGANKSGRQHDARAGDHRRSDGGKASSSGGEGNAWAVGCGDPGSEALDVEVGFGFG